MICPKFSGVQTTRQAQSACLAGKDLKRLLSQELLNDDTTVGEGLPPDLIPPGLTSKEVVRQLDALSALFSRIDLGLYRSAGVIPSETPIPLPAMAFRMGGVPFSLSYVGHGNFGIVLKIQTARRAYALKCFFPRDKELLTSGPYNEAAVGTFITAKGVSNMPHMLLAHPAAGWVLSDFVDNAYKNTPRQGPTWESFGFEVLDAQVKDNETTGVSGIKYRLDYGHLRLPNASRESLDPRVGQLFKTRESSGYIDCSAYLALFQTAPELRIPLMEHLNCLDPAKRVAVIQQCLAAPELRHYPLPSLVEAKFLSPQDINTLVGWLITHPDASIRAKAVFDPQLLTPENKARLESFWRTEPTLAPLAALYFQDADKMRRYLNTRPEAALVF